MKSRTFTQLVVLMALVIAAGGLSLLLGTMTLASPAPAMPDAVSLGTAPHAGPARPTGPLEDIRVGDSGASYVNIEFSPDMRFASWIELSASPLQPARAWLTGIVADTGDLIPLDGRGSLITEIYNGGFVLGSPQWGEDATGPFVIAISREHQLVMARPINAVSSEITILPTPPNPTRYYPYPAKLPSRDHAYVAYLQKDTAGDVQAWYIDLADPTVEHQVTFGPPGLYPPLNVPPLSVDIHRWFYDEPVFVYGYSDTVTHKLQIKQFDVSQPEQEPIPITADQFDHMDEFPAVIAGERYLIGGINNEAIGKLYERPPGSEVYAPIQTIEPAATLLMTPTSAVGFETFVWEGQAYASYQIRNDSRSILARTEPGEVWVTSLFDDSFSQRVSSAEPLVRADPEFYLGTSDVWVFYHAKPTSGNGVWELRRARSRIGDPPPLDLFLPITPRR